MSIDKLTNFARAISDRNRLRTLALLMDCPLCVAEISHALNVPQSTVSTHLAYLRTIGVVQATKKGTWTYYELSNSAASILDDLDDHLQWTDDPAVNADLARLHKRLGLRKDGMCVIGFKAQ